MAEPKSSPPGELSSTTDLLQRARQGDAAALAELLQRNIAPLRRWARGRLPAWTRDLRDTEDLVQETLTQTLRNLGHFEVRHEGALQAYLRQALLNRVRDEIRRVSRSHTGLDLAAAVDQEDPSASPLEQALGTEALQRYESALQRLRREDRDIIIARVEMQQSYEEIAAAHRRPSADAARMAVTRALLRLAEEMDLER